MLISIWIISMALEAGGWRQEAMMHRAMFTGCTEVSCHVYCHGQIYWLSAAPVPESTKSKKDSTVTATQSTNSLHTVKFKVALWWKENPDRLHNLSTRPLCYSETCQKKKKTIEWKHSSCETHTFVHQIHLPLIIELLNHNMFLMTSNVSAVLSIKSFIAKEADGECLVRFPNLYRYWFKSKKKNQIWDFIQYLPSSVYVMFLKFKI